MFQGLGAWSTLGKKTNKNPYSRGANIQIRADRQQTINKYNSINRISNYIVEDDMCYEKYSTVKGVWKYIGKEMLVGISYAIK